jgi:hypothetical protein
MLFPHCVHSNMLRHLIRDTQDGIGAFVLQATTALGKSIAADGLQGKMGLRLLMGNCRADYHRMRALPQVNPPPKAVKRTRSPGLTVPSRTASSRAMGTVAEEIFPYRSMVR